MKDAGRRDDRGRLGFVMQQGSINSGSLWKISNSFFVYDASEDFVYDLGAISIIIVHLLLLSLTRMETSSGRESNNALPTRINLI